MVNTLLLAYDKYPSDKDTENVLEYINLGFFAIFFMEMIVKLTVYGFREYVESKFNIFDASVVIISTIDVLVGFLAQSSEESESGGAVSALRAFRLMRIFKLAKSWKQF